METSDSGIPPVTAKLAGSLERAERIVAEQLGVLSTITQKRIDGLLSDDFFGSGLESVLDGCRMDTANGKELDYLFLVDKLRIFFLRNLRSNPSLLPRSIAKCKTLSVDLRDIYLFHPVDKDEIALCCGKLQALIGNPMVMLQEGYCEVIEQMSDLPSEYLFHDLFGDEENDGYEFHQVLKDGISIDHLAVLKQLIYSKFIRDNGSPDVQSDDETQRENRVRIMRSLVNALLLFPKNSSSATFELRFDLLDILTADLYVPYIDMTPELSAISSSFSGEEKLRVKEMAIIRDNRGLRQFVRLAEGFNSVVAN